MYAREKTVYGVKKIFDESEVQNRKKVDLKFSNSLNTLKLLRARQIRNKHISLTTHDGSKLQTTVDF